MTQPFSVISKVRGFYLQSDENNQTEILEFSDNWSERKQTHQGRVGETSSRKIVCSAFFEMMEKLVIKLKILRWSYVACFCNVKNLCWLHFHILKCFLEGCKQLFCVLSSVFQVYVQLCTTQMQDALLAQFCSSTAALRAAPAMHQESKEQTASLD